MNNLMKLKNTKKTENGDISYKSTGNNMVDMLFLSSYFEKHLEQVKIGTSEKEKLFSMFMRDPRYGMGRRDLGRVLLEQSRVDAKDIALCGRMDDLWHIPTDYNLLVLWELLKQNDVLTKKWMPRLTGKDKKYAKALCKEWKISEKEYRSLIKCDSTVEYKLSYAEKEDKETPLNDLFKKYTYNHPLVNTIDFEKVPSLAMTKYLNTFTNREDLKDRFAEYIEKVKQNKAKVNTTTANVYDAYKTANRGETNEAKEVIANKIIDNATIDVELNAICIVDSSRSMGWLGNNNDSCLARAYSIAYAIASKSTYAKNQVISFSSCPQLMTIKGKTLKEKYESMYTGDCSNTDFGRVMQLLQGLEKYPEYLVVLSDMEFDEGSYMSKQKTMELFKQNGAETKIIWWNLNNRNKTVPEFDEYGNIYLSGYNMQILKLLENRFDMTSYLDKILNDYKENVDKLIKTM